MLSQPPSTFHQAGFTHLQGGWTQAWECRLRCMTEMGLLWPGLDSFMISSMLLVPPSLTNTYICPHGSVGWWWWSTWNYWHVMGRYVFMKNAYGIVLRATGEAHLELWGAKHRYLRCILTQLTSLIKQVAIILNSTIDHQPSNPSWMFPVLYCVWKLYEDLAWDDAVSGFKPSSVPSEAFGTHKSWPRDA